MEIFSQFGLEAQIILVIIFALIFGSFASLISYRLANKQPIVFTRSKCVNCGVALKVQNLIPLFSWLWQRGKCSNCKVKISPRYPMIELSFVIAFLVIFFALHQQINGKMLFYFLVAGIFIVMSVIDLEQYFIPDSLQIFLAILIVIFVSLDGGSSKLITGVESAFLYLGFGLALFAFFYFTAGIPAIGIDDLKFFFVIGFLLGINNFLAFMMLSGIFGLLFGAAWQKIKKDETFPFAPAICLSAFVCMLFGAKINPSEILGSLLF
jgi:prepilin signal peptidase PulO-like enzyme (type II secretory pathway)